MSISQFQWPVALWGEALPAVRTCNGPYMNGQLHYLQHCLRLTNYTIYRYGSLSNCYVTCRHMKESIYIITHKRDIFKRWRQSRWAGKQHNEYYKYSSSKILSRKQLLFIVALFRYVSNCIIFCFLPKTVVIQQSCFNIIWNPFSASQ